MVSGPTIEGKVLSLEFSSAVDVSSVASGIDADFVIDDPDFPVRRPLSLRRESSADAAILRLAPASGLGFGRSNRVDLTLTTSLRSTSGVALGNPGTRTVRTTGASLDETAVRVSIGSLPTSFPSVVLDDSEDAVCVWLELDVSTNRVMGSDFDHVTGVWNRPQQLGGPVTWLSELVRVGDGAVIAWGDLASRRVLSRRFSRSGGGWQPTIPIASPTPGLQDDRVMLAGNDAGSIVAAWLAFVDVGRAAPRAVRSAFLAAGANSWSATHEVSVPNGWFASIARCSLGEDERALVAWSELDAASVALRLRCSRGVLGGGFDDTSELAAQTTPEILVRPNPVQPRPVASIDAVFWANNGEQWYASHATSGWGSARSLGGEFNLVIGEVSSSPNGTVHVVGIRPVGSTFSFSPARLAASGRLQHTSPINLTPDTTEIRSIAVRVLTNETALALWTERTATTTRTSYSVFEPGDAQLGRLGGWRLPTPLSDGTSLPLASGNSLGHFLIVYQDGDQISARFFH